MKDEFVETISNGGRFVNVVHKISNQAIFETRHSKIRAGKVNDFNII